MIISDLNIALPFRIKDLRINHYIFSNLDLKSGDLPPDIAVLPVVGVMIDQKNHYMEIETETKNTIMIGKE